MLKDSTKSPEFVKTVPKRGYQLICSVERMSTPTSEPNIELEDSDIEESTFASVAEEIQAQPQVEEPVSNEPSSKTDNTTPLSTAKISSNNNWITRAILFVAVLLPIVIFTLTKPAESHFRQIAEFSGVPVMTPANHPQLMQWMPSIKQCVARYVENHKNDVMPVKDIATGGQSNKLVLNYIHDTDHSFENVTLRIFAGQNDPTDICK
jgi:cholera toxin transcriptional activator